MPAPFRSFPSRRQRAWLRAWLVTAAIATVLPSAAVQATGDGGRPGRLDPIVGLWNAKATLVICGTGQPVPLPPGQRNPFDAMALFAADGTMHDTNANDPRARSSSFGTWRRIGPRAYEFAFQFFRFEPSGSGVPIGSQVVRHEVRLAWDGQSYTSQGTATFYDVDGNPLPAGGCSTSTATRFR
ncbi:MAG: hypothetical protein AB7G13_30695 [Lautropia sp.]